MSKTSASQFETMVTFMERHGDLSKPRFNAKGRIKSITRWEELTTTLNSCGRSPKTTEKWKKVWADLKNNTRKKADRLHRAPGGGPAALCKLSDLERRVLQLIGVHITPHIHIATSIKVEEAGLTQVANQQPYAMPNISEQIPKPALSFESITPEVVLSPSNSSVEENTRSI